MWVQRQFNKQSKGKQNKNSFTTSHVQAGVGSSPGNQGSIMCNVGLGRQTSSLQTSSLSFSFPQLYMVNMMPHGLNDSFGPFGSAVLVESPTNFPSLLTAGMEWEGEKALTWYEHFSAVAETSLLSAQAYNIAL